MSVSTKKIGVLALQGDVSEHVAATDKAITKSKLKCIVIAVRTKKDLEDLSGLIIPGGESTVLYKLLQKLDMFESVKKVPAIFGTCAGTILIAKKIQNEAEGQKTLELMDISAARNAYGEQTESFEEIIDTKLGKVNAFFIRAPKIAATGKNIKILAHYNNQVVACEEKIDGKYYLASCFHPELTTTLFHEYFLSKCK